MVSDHEHWPIDLRLPSCESAARQHLVSAQWDPCARRASDRFLILRQNIVGQLVPTLGSRAGRIGHHDVPGAERFGLRTVRSELAKEIGRDTSEQVRGVVRVLETHRIHPFSGTTGEADTESDADSAGSGFGRFARWTLRRSLIPAGAYSLTTSSYRVGG